MSRYFTSAYGQPKLRKLLTTAAGAAMLCAVPALAQQQDDAAPPVEDETSVQDKVIVTGTSVRGRAPVGSTVEVVDQRLIQESGQANTTDLLRTIPSVINLGNDEGRGGGVQSAQVNVSQGKSLNLRGLGASSTLVLVNGRRYIPAGTIASSYDVSSIARRGVQRIEVVADGASAIYGTDAVAGVVNFITQRDYDGLEVYASQGYADGFDETYYGVAFGKTWEGGEAFFTWDHYDRGGLLGSQREENVQDLRPFGGPDLRTPFANPGNIVANGTTYAIPAGQDGTGLSTGAFVAGTSNRESDYDYRSLLVDQEQDNFLAYISQNLTPDFRIWAEGIVSNRDYNGFGDSLSRGGAQGTLVVPDTNPWFVHPTDPNATSVTVQYGFGELIPPKTVGGEEPWQIAVGGEWDAFGDWVVDGFYSYGENTAFRNADKLKGSAALAAVSDPNPATAFNPFCDADVFQCAPQATIDAMTTFLLIQGDYEQSNAVLKASGPIFTLPGGEVSLAVGAEYLDTTLTTTIANFLGAAPVNRVTLGERDVTSLFAEAVVPVFGPDNAIPGFRELEAVLAVRTEDYSDFGRTTNPKIGVNWRPVDNFKLRGTYGTSFHAPTLAQIDTQATRTFTLATVFDPVQNQTIQTLQLLGTLDGVGPEEADTYTIGFDWEPISNLNVSMTYYDIDYQNRIASLAASQIMNNQELFSDRFINDPTDAQIQAVYDSPFYRDAQLPYDQIDAILEARAGNLNADRQSGIDGSISYDFSALQSDWTVGASFTKILEAEQEQLNGLIVEDTLDVINFPVDLRARTWGAWDYENVRVVAFVNYVDSYENNLVTPTTQVESWVTLDLSASLSAPDDAAQWLQGASFRVNVTNATNEDPPFSLNPVAVTAGIYDSQNASIIGRQVTFEISKKW